MHIDAALQKAEAWLDEIDGVVGVAQGKVGEEDCITVFLAIREAAGKIPERFMGYAVCTEFTGSIHIQPG